MSTTETKITKLPVAQEQVILVALAKFLGEQATYLLGELKHRPKMKFKDMLISNDAFVKEIEGGLSDEHKADLEAITDALHEGMAGLRKDLANKL